MTWKVYQNMQRPIQSDVSRCHKSLSYLIKKYLLRAKEDALHQTKMRSKKYDFLILHYFYLYLISLVNCFPFISLVI